MNSLNEKFDPNKHQAMIEIEDNKEPGTIVQEIQKGYVWRKTFKTFPWSLFLRKTLKKEIKKELKSL